MQNIKQLLELRNELISSNIELSFNKINGRIDIGKWCEIHWKDSTVDYGYFFTLPVGNFVDEGDVFVHIPNPNNECGMDSAPEVFTHLYELLNNENINEIKAMELLNVEYEVNQKLNVEIPRGFYNCDITIDNHFISDTNDSSNWKTLKFPLPNPKNNNVWRINRYDTTHDEKVIVELVC